MEHGAPRGEVPAEVFFGPDKGLALVDADMNAWLAAQPECECEGLCFCDDEPTPPVDVPDDD